MNLPIFIVESVQILVKYSFVSFIMIIDTDIG